MNPLYHSYGLNIQMTRGGAGSTGADAASMLSVSKPRRSALPRAQKGRVYTVGDVQATPWRWGNHVGNAILVGK